MVLVSNGPGELSTWVRPLALLPAPPDCRWQPQHPGASGEPEPGVGALPQRHRPGASGRCWNGTCLPASRQRRRFWRLLLRPGPLWPLAPPGRGGVPRWRPVLDGAALGSVWATATSPTRSGWPAGPAGTTASPPWGPGPRALLAPRWRRRCTVVGDLMADLGRSRPAASCRSPPASGWPSAGVQAGQAAGGRALLLETADRLARAAARLPVPAAPGAHHQPGGAAAAAGPPIRSPAATAPACPGCCQSTLLQNDGVALVTPAGTRIELVRAAPAHGPLSQCAWPSPPWAPTPPSWRAWGCRCWCWCPPSIRR
jgi:hypothetical protein